MDKWTGARLLTTCGQGGKREKESQNFWQSLVIPFFGIELVCDFDCEKWGWLDCLLL
jgi:hypothetical protein